MTALLVIGGVVWLAAFVWLLLPPPRVRLPEPVSEHWLTQHVQQDR